MAAQASDRGNDRASQIDKSEDFYFDDGDFILHSAPGLYFGDESSIVVEFRVHRAKLAKSPVFADLLELGQATELTSQLPIVSLSEHYDIITALLRFLYGDICEFPEDFDYALPHGPQELYEACFKYDMPVAQLAVEMMIRCAMHTLYPNIQ